MAKAQDHRQDAQPALQVLEQDREREHQRALDHQRELDRQRELSLIHI